MPDPQHEPTISLPAADPASAPTAPVASTPADLTGPPDVDVLPEDLAGHTRYRITRLLGQGGMGAVYLAEHTIMGRPVALKVIHPRYTASPTAVERFRREVRAAGKLSHPNIVAAYDADHAGATHFLVMEYVEGQTLAAYVHETGPLPVEEACGYVLQAAQALRYAHEKGMVHRDIKPDNLMRTPAGEVRVLDFGLARLAESSEVVLAGPAAADPALTAAGSVMGTPDYMAPEQARDSSAADVRADIYALGATLFHLLTGTVPFPGGSAADKLRRHELEPAPPVSAVREGVPPGLERVVARMLAKRPQDRPQTPAEVARRLRPYTHPSRFWWWTSGGVAAALLALLAVGLIWYYAIWPGRGEIEFTGAGGGRVVAIGGEDTSGRIHHYELQLGRQAYISVPPGNYVFDWKDGFIDREQFSTQKVTVKRGEVVRIDVYSQPPPPPPVPIVR
ncbi:MAG TPA: serine/threonine-protein kinase [Fimbriiglobus sp.]|jgi:hypothetical protein|nr:serine/threonine-protein kinase [Fimbriiglobus sp.]